VFNLKNDGKPGCYSWPEVGSGNAWLVYDRDLDWKIDSGAELFGDFTPHANGGVKGHRDPNGFLALAWYDQPAQGGNLDGIIDAKDAIWTHLRLWIDTHCFKTPQAACSALPGELYTLPDKGIFSIGLVYSLTDKPDVYGNNFKLQAPVNLDPGTPSTLQQSHDVRVANDVWLVEKK
jgi:hypothetical protein